eukprot:scaffold77610_cov58-Phaeocystis_antarctica.AAC.1
MSRPVVVEGERGDFTCRRRSDPSRPRAPNVGHEAGSKRNRPPPVYTSCAAKDRLHEDRRDRATVVRRLTVADCTTAERQAGGLRHGHSLGRNLEANGHARAQPDGAAVVSAAVDQRHVLQRELRIVVHVDDAREALCVKRAAVRVADDLVHRVGTQVELRGIGEGEYERTKWRASALKDQSGVAATHRPVFFGVGGRPHRTPVEIAARLIRRVRDACTQLSNGRRGHHAGADRSDPASTASRSDAEAAAGGRTHICDVRVGAWRRVRKAGAPDAVAVREIGGEVREGHLAKLGPGDATMAVGRANYLRA